MDILSRVTTGSQLYGLATPTSDNDWKGVMLPSLSSLILQRGERSIQDKDNSGIVIQDGEMFSLQRFMELLCQGQPIAIEMISSPPTYWLESGEEWKTLYDNRRRFYSKNMAAFLCYCRAQTSKYSLRAERMEATEKVLTKLKYYFDTWLPATKLSVFWDYLPESEGIVKTVNERNSNKDNRVYSVYGREIQATVTLSHAISVVQAIYDSYGERVKRAKEMGAQDFKALHHAFRVCYQVLDICKNGEPTLPFTGTTRDFLMDVKLGRKDFINDALGEQLDALMSQCEAAIAASNLPEKADSCWAEQFVLDVYSRRYKLSDIN